MSAELTRTGGYTVWVDRLSAHGGAVEVRFVGRGPRAGRDAVLGTVAPGAPGTAGARQIHSAQVLIGDRQGTWGEGDALLTGREELALSVATADCVPVLLAAGCGNGPIAAVHAGWRGIVAGVVGEVLERMADAAGELVAWIGPAIGACCYEVGWDVAERVAAASTDAVVRPRRAGRPHLDLSAAVRQQLLDGGAAEVRLVEVCTRCRDDLLWSYRGQGKAAGRNLSYIWRSRRGDGRSA